MKVVLVEVIYISLVSWLDIWIFLVEWSGFKSWRNLHGSNGGAATTSTGLGEGLLVQVGTLGASGQVGLHLAELGKVKGSNLLGLLNLLLVRLDLALKLVNESLHPLVVLPVLVLLVGQLLDVPLRLAQVLQFERKSFC